MQYSALVNFLLIIVSALWIIPNAESSQSIDVWRYRGSGFGNAQILRLDFSEKELPRKRVSGVVNGSKFAPDAPNYRADLSFLDFQVFNPISNDLSGRFENCENVLNANQAFSLGRMVETGYLLRQEAEAVAASAQQLQPQQIIFLEQFFETSAKSYRENFRDRMGRVYQEPYEQYLSILGGAVPESRVQILEGSLWVVAGNLNERQVPLPLEISNQIQIDRRKYPYVWEFGRFAKSKGAHVKSLITTATREIVRQAVMQGQELSKVTLFAQSYDEIHTKHYQMQYGFKPFAQLSDHSSGKILSQNLMDFVRSDFFTDEDRAHVLSGLQEALIERVFHFAPFFENTDIQIRDFSQNAKDRYQAMLAEQLLANGFSGATLHEFSAGPKRQIYDTEASRNSFLGKPKNGAIQLNRSSLHLESGMNVPQVLSDLNAIEIYGIGNLSESKGNEELVRIILKTYLVLTKKLQETESSDAIQKMNFVIPTADVKVRSALMNLNSDRTIEVVRPTTIVHRVTKYVKLTEQTWGFWLIQFSYETILQLIKQYPEIWSSVISESKTQSID